MFQTEVTRLRLPSRDTTMNRKEAVQAYKETRRPMGIYCVRNTKSGQTLLGSSVDLPGMLNRIRFQLEMNGHPNKALQQDWNTLGPAAFTFEILDTLSAPEDADYQPADDLKELLAMWMEKLSPYEERGYHGRRVVDCSPHSPSEDSDDNRP